MNSYKSVFFDCHSLANEKKLMDAIRGIAVILVYISHADANRFLWYQPFISIKGVLGELGVNLFFILSGYLIWRSATNNFEKKCGLAIYIVNRVTRIVPLYLACLLFCIVVFSFVSTTFKPEINVYNVVRHLTFTQGLNPSVSRTINPVLWSLTHEFIFYLLVPLLFLIKRIWVIILISMLATVFSIFIPSAIFSPFLGKAVLFAYGIFLSSRNFSPNISMSILLLIVATVLPLERKVESMIFAMFIFSVLTNLYKLNEPAVKILLSLLAPIGVISYSIYIWHYLLLELSPPLFNQFDVLRESMLARGVSFAVFCLGVSTLSYFLIEKPGVTKLKDFIINNTRLKHSATR